MFEKLFDVFSRREKDLANGGIKPLTPEFRNRVLMLLRDTLQYDFRAFLGQLHNKAAYLYGIWSLGSFCSFLSGRRFSEFLYHMQ